MWAILRINNNKYKMLTKSLNAELKSKAIFYFPKVIIEKIKLNKRKSTQCSVLGNYVFCYHNSFKNPKNIEKLKFIHGLKYFLKNYDNYQKDIIEFINYCKNNENVMEPLIDALKSEATVGEVNQIFKEEFGTWEAPSGV